MKIAYFDTIAGISGDMTLGALISAGVQLDELLQEINKLNFVGVEFDASHIIRNGIEAVKININYISKLKHYRHLNDIVEIIDNSKLSERVKVDAKKIFIEIARAEAKVHGVPIDKVHFHEVGAIDSIVDIVGTAICLDKLGIERVYSSPVKLGSGGLVDTEHGKLPIPAPATLEILHDYPIMITDVPQELTTPTGAAIIKAMSSGVLSFEKVRVEKIGYGAGEKEINQIPNLLRVMIGELEPAYDFDEVVQVETNIDDMSPEIYPYVIEKLMNLGTYDAFLIPIIMKKGRPGILISIIVNRSKLDEVLNILFKETTTIGVRIQQIERRKVIRNIKEVLSRFGIVKMKSIQFDDEEILVPEFEECKRIAIEKGIAIQEVYMLLNEEFHSKKQIFM